MVDAGILAGLEKARETLAALIDESSETCRVGAADGLHETGPRCECCGAGISDATVKDAIRTYVQMWALFPFDVALAAARGEATEGELAYLQSICGVPA
jgi:hypothetical protein